MISESKKAKFKRHLLKFLGFFECSFDLHGHTYRVIDASLHDCLILICWVRNWSSRFEFFQVNTFKNVNYNDYVI